MSASARTHHSERGTALPHLNLRACRRAATAAVALTVVSLLSPAAAQGAELRFADSTRDVVKLDFADESFEPVADPATRNADIKSGYIHYRKGRLVLRANFVELRRASNILTNFSGMVRTNEKRRWYYDVTTSPGRYAGHDTLESASGRGNCEIGHMFDYAENFARVSIPLRCLSHPKWVRIRMGAATLTFDRAALESGEIKPGELELRMDDALSDTSDFTAWSPRVRRG
jgi:hypothetical protein